MKVVTTIIVIIAGLVLVALTIDLEGVFVRLDRGDTGHICGPIGLICVDQAEPWRQQNVLPARNGGAALFPASNGLFPLLRGAGEVGGVESCGG